MCVATLKALNTFFETKIKDPEIAKLAKKVEFNYIGVSGGIMDQMVSSIGIHGKAFFMNCKNLEYELINFPENWKFCLIDSEVQRNLRDSSYNERFAELQEAEKKLGVEYLGGVKKENFQIVSNSYFDIHSDIDIGKVDQNYLYEVLSKIDLKDADALFVSCTALPVLSIIDKLEKKINKFVLSSN